MNHGEPAQVTIGGRLPPGTVLYERGDSVRVRIADGRERTVPAERVRLCAGLLYRGARLSTAAV